MPRFQIQDDILEAPLEPDLAQGLEIRSVPRPYRVEFRSREPLDMVLGAMVSEAKHPLLAADERVIELHLRACPAVAGVPILAIPASEAFKTIEGALTVCDFLEANGATKGSTLVVAGGGIVQDVCGFAAGMYKRGIPWAYLPTTLLSQGDSCIGAKTGLNRKAAKNLLCMFSAPRRVVIHTGFLHTLAEEDLGSGLGEILRLHVTAGPEFLDTYEARWARYAAGDLAALEALIASALTAKRAIIERDEFELDLRRAMNWGHSTGHALEALSGYAIPHGLAVATGLLVENHIAIRRGLLDPADHARVLRNAAPLIPPRVRQLLAALDVSSVVDYLAHDKKVEGRTLKLAALQRIGAIRFIDLPLEPATADLIAEALRAVVSELQAA